MTRSGRPGLDSPVEAGAAPFSAPLASAADADPAPNAALRPSRCPRRAARPLCRLGDASAVRGRDPGASRGAQRHRRVRRLAHGRGDRRGCRRARIPAVDALERRRTPRARARPVHAAYERAGRDRRRPDRLRACARAVSADRQRLESRTRLRLAAGARARGCRGARRLGRLRADRGAGPALARAARPSRGAGVHLRGRRARRDPLHRQSHGLHRRGRRRAAGRRRPRRRALGSRARTRPRPLRPRRARHAAAGGLLPAARQRHLPGDRRDLRRARLGLRARHRLHRCGRAAPDQGGRARAKAVGVRDGSVRWPAAGNADREGRRGHVRHALADARAGDRPGLRAGRAGAAGVRADDRRPRQKTPRARAQKAHLFPRGALMAAAESYPEDLRYHPEHDWARMDGDEATLGITWFAQDALGELVHFEAPEEGATLTKDQAYAEVESVKAVSDVIAPLSGEVLEVNGAVADAPETVNDDPYGEGWLVRVRLTNPGEADALMNVEAYKQHLAEQG